MFPHHSVGSPNYEERLVRCDGAWTVLHRHAAPATEPLRWHRAVRAPHRPTGAEPLDGTLTRRSFALERFPDGGDPVRARLPVLVGAQVTVSVLRADSASETVTFTDHDGDQVVSVLEGGASLETPCGTLRANAAEHIWIPRGMAHRWRVDKLGLRAVLWEFVGELSLPRGSCNRYGQLGSEAPFTLRELHRPNWFLRPHHVHSGVACMLRREGVCWECTSPIDPLATTGWDGAVYPVSVAWEVPLTRRKEAVLFECKRSSLRTRISSAPEGPSLAPIDRVTLRLDADGAASLQWVPSGIPSPPAEAPGGIVVELLSDAALSLTANGVAHCLGAHKVLGTSHGL